jgi:hypothetical protein
MISIFGRKRGEKPHADMRVWSLGHVVSKPKPKASIQKAVQKPPAKKRPKPVTKGPKPVKIKGRAMTRQDDLESLLEAEKMLSEMVAEMGKAKHEAGKDQKAEKGERKEKAEKGKKEVKRGLRGLLRKPPETHTPEAHPPEDMKEKEEEAPAAGPGPKAAQITTQIDEMVGIVTEKKRVKANYIASRMKVSESKVMEWAEILEGNGMITIHYPAFGKPELRAAQKKEE